MACWVRTLTVKVPLLHETNHAVLFEWWYKQQNYVPFVSCWDLHQSAKAALKVIAEVQASADKIKSKNVSSFDDKPSSTFQLVDVSVDWISKGITSLHQIKANANLQTTNNFRRGSPSHFNVGRLHELIVGPTWNPTFNRMTPSLLFKYIVESISVGARFAPTTFQAFKFIVALLTSFTDFQLIVELNLIPHSEGECNAAIIFGDKAALLKSDGAQSAPNSLFNDNSKFIIVSSFPTKFSDTFIKLIVTSMFGRSKQSLLNDDFQLVVKLIPILTSEGTRAPLSMLIVGCGYSEISFHFCEDCRIFREGVKDDPAITMADC
jgi:hypothetical protein